VAQTERNDGRMHKVTRSVAKKALAPVAASAAAYAARKLPQLFEEKVAPKLRERGGARAAAQDLAGAVGTHVGHAKETVASKAGDAKETVASKAGDSSIPSVGGESARATPAASNGGSNDREREGARQKREQNRQARRKATT
jgi:hypothetical protein